MPPSGGHLTARRGSPSMRPSRKYIVTSVTLILTLFSPFAARRRDQGVASLDPLRGRVRLLALLTSVLLAVVLASAQDHSKNKLPIIDKITSSASHQAFSGIVESLDEKRNILNVNSVEGGATEIFPVKKSTPVVTADGTRLRPASLTPGTNIIVYFELHADHRTVKRIEILAGESKKQAPHS
jgi:hypothetical protein